MKQILLIAFAQDGTGHCLFTEKVPLSDIGLLEVRRASNVEFNATTQKWEVSFTDNPGKVVFTDESREACIDWEVSTLNRRLP